jgi:hypothetical protein
MTAKFSQGDLCLIIKAQPKFSHLIGTTCTITEVIGHASAGDILEPKGKSCLCLVTGMHYKIELSCPVDFAGILRTDAVAPEQYLVKITPDAPKSKNIVEKKLKVY